MIHFPIHTPLGLGDLLDRVFRLYRLHASQMMLAVAIFVVPLGILSALLTQEATLSSFFVLRDLLETGTPPLQQSDGNVLAVLLTPIGFVVQGFIALVSAQLTIDALHRRTLSIPAALRIARKKFFPWMGMVILMGLAMMLVAAVVAIIAFIFIFLFGTVFAVFASSAPIVPDGEMNVALIIGIVLIVVFLYLGAILLFGSPFLYFWGRWSVCVPVILMEDQGPAGALGRSWNLTQKNGRRAMGYVFLTYLLTFMVVGTPAAVLELVAAFTLPRESEWLLLAIISGVSVVSSVLTSPLGSIAYVLFYYELLVRQESYDLSFRLSPADEPAPSSVPL